MKNLEKLIEICEVSVRELDKYWGISYYSEYDNTIYLNPWRHDLFHTGCRLLFRRPIDPQWTIAHEVGHAFVSSFEVEKDEEIVELFGGFDQEYSEFGIFKSLLKPNRPGFLTPYCQTHPEEDFAEIFAYLLKTDLKVAHIRAGQFDDVTVKKMMIVRQWIKDVLKEHG